jgi:AcrR family transcriptional regulator
VRRREPLTREAVLRTAVAVADRDGVAALSMRKLAEQLGVEAMSLYHHVANKDEVLDGIVDQVFNEIELPVDEPDWKNAMRRRAGSVRAVLSRHTWALGLLESRRNPGPATLRHHDWVIGCLRTAGFSIEMAAHAFSAVDSYVYGFILQESILSFDTSQELEDVVVPVLRRMPTDAYPHLTEMITDHALQPGYAYADEFAFGLELILDGLARIHAAPATSPSRMPNDTGRRGRGSG